MEDMAVLVVYIGVFLLLCLLLVRTLKGNRSRDWGRLFGLEALAVAGSFCAIHIFDALPGNGMMPGLTWFAEVFYSMGAAILYAVLLAVTIILCIWKEINSR